MTNFPLSSAATTLRLFGREIGPHHPALIIAEAGVNHNGDLARALRLIEVAAEAGADAVKFQTFCADRLVTREAPKARYQLETTDTGESQYEMLRRLELSQADHAALIAHCAQHGILFLSTPFDEESAAMLAELGVAAFKIPSGEITNLPFLSAVAAWQRPIILSTGMATEAEVRTAVECLRASGNGQLALLHCVSNYPAEPADVNLRAMPAMASLFGVPVGFSDHTLGIDIAAAAVALGACIVEKHFTLDRALPGPDHRASVEPEELAQLVRSIRRVESALGHGRKEPAASEANTAQVARKSLVAARDLAAGTLLTEDAIGIKRPGTGLAPALRPQLVGRVLKSAVPAGTLFTWEHFA